MAKKKSKKWPNCMRRIKNVKGEEKNATAQFYA